MKKVVVTLIVSLFLFSAVFAAKIDEKTLPPSKRTALGLYLTAKDAYAKWKSDPEHVIIVDVRTPEEFRDVGLPKMAHKVPLSPHADEFVKAVGKIAGPKETVLVICRSGNRSAAAVNMLAQAGYKKAYSIVDGFEGDRNSDRSSADYGQRTVNGWKNAGLPWVKSK